MDDPASDIDTAVTDLTLAIGQLMRRLRAEVNPGDLSRSQTGALARLDRAGSATTADLARADHVKPQSMAATLASLEQEGLVGRRPHPTDRRQVLFGLTEAGIAAQSERRIAKRGWLAAAIGGLDAADRRTLIAAAALMQRLADS